MLPSRLDAALQARLRRHLAQFERRVAPLSGRRAAAVALTLVPGSGGEPCFLLTRRTGGLRNHGGQFALPGGRVDAGEQAVDTARRELAEEVGVEVPPDGVLGFLDDFATRSGFVITPVVLWAPQATRLRPSPDEVALVYRVAVAELYRPDVPLLAPSEHPDRPLLSLPMLGTHIFSPTAAMIYQLKEVAFEGRDTRVDHYEQPRFAWR